MLITSLTVAPHVSPFPSFSSGILNDNDLYRFCPTINEWTALNPSNPPSARALMGFTATPNGMLYAFGGWGYGLSYWGGLSTGSGEGGVGGVSKPNKHSSRVVRAILWRCVCGWTENVRWKEKVRASGACDGKG
jgi:hypothetical protein